MSCHVSTISDSFWIQVCTLRCQINEYTRLSFSDFFLHPTPFKKHHQLIYVYRTYRTRLLGSIFHPTCLLGPTYLSYLSTQNIHPTRLLGPTRLIGTWEYLLSVFLIRIPTGKVIVCHFSTSPVWEEELLKKKQLASPNKCMASSLLFL